MCGAMPNKRKSAPQPEVYPRDFGALYPGPTSGSLRTQWSAYVAGELHNDAGEAVAW
jgi:hypothetical protein